MSPGSAARAPRRRPLLRAAIVVCLLAGAAAPPAFFVWRARYGRDVKVAKLRARAAIELRVGRAQAAVASLEQAIALDPKHVEARRELGEALLAAGRRADARAAFETAAGLDLDAVEPRLRLAFMAVEEHDLPRARTLLAWLEDPGRSARVRPYAMNLALLDYQACYLAGDVPGAARAADRALSINPRAKPALLARAGVAMAEGNPEHARALIERGLDEAPGDPQLSILLSRALEQAGERESARAVLEKAKGTPADEEALAIRRAELASAAKDAGAAAAVAASLSPATGAATREYVSALAAATRGDPAAAEAAFRRALAANPLLTPARLELARLLFAREDYSGARAELRAVLDDDPLSRTARLQLARVSIILGDYAKGAEEAERVLLGSSRDLEAVRLLVAARAKQGRAADAERFFAALEQKEPGNEVVALGRNLSWLAKLDLDSAIEGSERLLAESPTARGALEVLAAAYAAKRGLADALERLRLFMASDPRFAPVRLQVASLYAALGRLDLADEELSSLVRAAPDYAPAHLARGSIAELRGDMETAGSEAEVYMGLRPDDPAGRALFARSLFARGFAERALAVAESQPIGALEGRARLHAIALARTGFAAAVEIGDLERAKKRLRAASEGDAGSSAAILGAAAFALGRDAEAMTAVSGAVSELKPGEAADPDAQWVAAAAALARGQVPLALRRARLSRPGGSIARLLVLVDALLASGDREGAKRAAEGAAAPAEGGREPPGPIARALAEYAAKATPDEVARLATPLHRLVIASSYGFKKPVRALAEALRREQKAPVLVPLLVARALEDAGEKAGARAVLEEAVARRPDSLAALEACGAMLVERGLYVEAARLLERAIALAPGEPRIRIFAGLARERLGDRSAAIASYRQAVELDPTSVLARTNLAWLLLRDSDTVDEALEQAVRARELAPSSGRVLDTLGLAQLLRDRVAEALATLSRAREASPAEPRVRYHLGLAYRRLGQRERALAELDMAILLGPNTEEGIAAAKAREEVLDELSGGRRAGGAFETAGRLSPGDEVQDSLGPKGARHFYRLDLSKAQRLSLRYRGPRDSPTEIALGLRDAQGARVVKRTAVPASIEIEWRLALRAGTYSLEVGAASGTSIANYRLEVVEDVEEPRGEQEPDDSVADAQKLAPGVPREGALEPLEDTDVYLLPDLAGAPLDLRIRSFERTQAVVSLVEPGELGDLCLKTFAIGPSRTADIPSIRLPPRGLALVLAGPPQGGGAYEVEVRPSPVPPEGAPSVLDEPDDVAAAAHDLPGRSGTRAGTISPFGDRDLVRLPEGRSSLEIRAPEDLGLLVEALVEPPGSPPRVLRTIAVERGRAAKIGSIGAPGLLLAIRAADPAGFSLRPYGISWGPEEAGADPEPDDDLETAAPLAPGKVSGTIDSPSDRDVRRLEGPRARAYSLSFSALDVPLVLSIVAAPPQGRVRVERRIEVAPGAPLAIEQWTPAEGAAALEVASAGAAGRYEIELAARPRTADVEAEPNEDAAFANPLVFGAPLAGRIDSRDDRDVFAIDVPEGARDLGISFEALDGTPPAVAAIEGDFALPARRTDLPSGPRLKTRVPATAGKRVFIVVERGRGAAPFAPARYRIEVSR